MKVLMRATAIAALMGLTACGGGTNMANEVAGNQSNAAATAPGRAAPANAETPPPVSNAAGPSISPLPPSTEMRALLIGRWAEDGNCAAAIEIREDGSFSSPQAGDGRWELSSMGYLDLVGGRATIELAVQEVDQSAMTTVNPRGQIGHWTRC